MPASIIFYSWLSDLPPEQNHTLILRCLEKSALAIRADGGLRVEPVVDRDTAGVPGAPDIAATIFEKIDACDVFVCDLTIVGKLPNGRPTPNPNVMLELGYALKTRGWGRILLVLNEQHGGPSQLPFDLRGKRVVTYRTGPDMESLGQAEEHLSEQLLAALQLLYKGTPQGPSAGGPIPSDDDLKWMEAHSVRAFRDYPREIGLSKQVFAALSPEPGPFAHTRLLEAADRAQVHTFGWPIGVMSQDSADMTPRPVTDGILTRITHLRDSITSFDYWTLRNDGSFYLLKSPFEENVGAKKTLFFDTRVVRATEVCMYLLRLYANLRVPEVTRVYLMIRYAGLAGSVLKGSSGQPMFRPRGPAIEDFVAPHVTTTLAGLRSDMVEIVKTLTRPLFILYDFFELNDASYDHIVTEYQNGRFA